MASIVFLPVLFLCATLGLYYLAISAPALESGERLDLHFPRSFDDLKNITNTLSDYQIQHFGYVLSLFSAAFLWKQSFGIPGSAGLNIASGALFGFWLGFPLSCILTAIGATNCYVLSYLFGHKLINRYFPEKLAWFRSVVHANRANLTYYLLFLRLFPMSPNWFLNIASPHIGIPIHQFFFTVFFAMKCHCFDADESRRANMLRHSHRCKILCSTDRFPVFSSQGTSEGLMPYNFVCVHGGSILRDISSFNDIFTWGRMFQLFLIACVALIPGFYLKKSRRTHDDPDNTDSSETLLIGCSQSSRDSMDTLPVLRDGVY